MIFWGAIQINSPTKKAPRGSRGRLIILAASAADSALSTMIGKPLMSNHDGPKIGEIRRVKVAGNWLVFSGQTNTLEPRGKGLSWEASSCRVKDFSADVWTVDRVEEFRGIAAVDNPASRCRNLKVV